jgi:hypothetical protein
VEVEGNVDVLTEVDVTLDHLVDELEPTEVASELDAAPVVITVLVTLVRSGPSIVET